MQHRKIVIIYLRMKERKREREKEREREREREKSHFLCICRRKMEICPTDRHGRRTMHCLRAKLMTSRHATKCNVDRTHHPPRQQSNNCSLRAARGTELVVRYRSVIQIDGDFHGLEREKPDRAPL